ncbi:flagellar assembly protein FliH [Ideonella livida]|uniref:Flagellar assembly protein FliH n=1 Tax=Ideonella livida TaxID=2707176 RepID=A0A7C9PI24_9BURK|nr:flagellar assembly protein FliH [Ideonella livida]NDY92329.1 flagellar biosynthesis protein [Ideonella livida]
MNTPNRNAPRQVPPPPGTQRAPAAYQRFIPREELEGFASWTPEAIGPGGRPAPSATFPDHGPRREPPAPPPPDPVELAWRERLAEAEARGLAEGLQQGREEGLREGHAQGLSEGLQQGREQGWHDGHRDGLEALDAARRQFALQVSAQVGQLVAQLQDQLQDLEQTMADAVGRSTLLLARQVLRTELRQHPEQVLHAAREAVAAMMLSARHIRLMLHPDDLALVREGAEQVLAGRPVTLVADAQLDRGGCRVESDLGRVDATLATRWWQAASALGDAPAWEPEAPTPTEAEPASAPAPEQAPSPGPIPDLGR